jgi:hypothetical protein
MRESMRARNIYHDNPEGDCSWGWVRIQLRSCGNVYHCGKQSDFLAGIGHLPHSAECDHLRHDCWRDNLLHDEWIDPDDVIAIVRKPMHYHGCSYGNSEGHRRRNWNLAKWCGVCELYDQWTLTLLILITTILSFRSGEAAEEPAVRWQLQRGNANNRFLTELTLGSE